MHPSSYVREDRRTERIAIGNSKRVTLGMLALWILNDHWWKSAYSSWLTGKLSDIASLVVCPLLVIAAIEICFPQLSRRVHRYALIATIAFFGFLVVAIKLWEPAAWLYQWGMGLAQWPWTCAIGLLTGSSLAEFRPVFLAKDPSDLHDFGAPSRKPASYGRTRNFQIRELAGGFKVRDQVASDESRAHP